MCAVSSEIELVCVFFFVWIRGKGGSVASCVGSGVIRAGAHVVAVHLSVVHI